MKRFITVAITLSLIISLNSCWTDSDGARKVLERSGCKEVKTGGYNYFNGSEDDMYKTKFTAIAPNGEIVSGCVTKGLFKGSTIRLND